MAVGVLADIGEWTPCGSNAAPAFTEKVALLRTALIFRKKKIWESSLEVPRAIFPLKHGVFLIFRCRHGGFLWRPRPRRCPGPWLCGFLPWIPLLDSSPGFLSGFLAWIPLLDSSSGFLSWIPLWIPIWDSAPRFLSQVPLLDSSLDSLLDSSPEDSPWLHPVSYTHLTLPTKA